MRRARVCARCARHTRDVLCTQVNELDKTRVMKGPLKPSIETLTLVIAHKKAAAAPSALLVHLSVRFVCTYVLRMWELIT